MSVIVALVVACAGSPTAAPSTPSIPFTLAIEPVAFIGMTMSGSRAVFLVTVSGSPSDGPVDIAASATGAAVTVQPQALEPGVVGEVTIVPGAVTGDVELDVAISARRGDVERDEVRTLIVTQGEVEDSLRAEADAHLAPFVAWLGTEHPELGITDATAWEGMRGSWVLIVEHYLYFSDEWELDLEWHVMVPPSDWSRISLRKRWTEARPSFAYEIESVAGGDAPREIAPPEAVWR